MSELPAQIIETEKVLGKIVSEYPLFANERLSVSKRFVLSDGRASNTFLIESDNPERQKFIAKSYVRGPESLLREYYFLKLLQESRAHSPRLLDPEHQPQDLMLMEYIDGPTAPEVLEQGHEPNDLFIKIGETVGKIHTIDVPFIGSPNDHKDETWKEHQMERINNRLPQMRQLLGSDLFADLEKMIGNTQYILDEESQKTQKLVHRDVYLDNFIVDSSTGNLMLIDYGIAMGGRPLYDLAKFYIWTLSKYPDQKDAFFEGYSKFVDLPENLSDVLRFYIIRELFGMIDFFEKIGDQEQKTKSVEALKDFVRGEGILNRLLV